MEKRTVIKTFCCCLVTQLCPTFLTPWTVAHQLLCLWDSPGKNAGVGCHSLFQGIFPTQGSNPSLLLGRGFPDGSYGKESACNAGDQSLIPGLGRSPGKGNGYPLQYSCLENSIDRGAWWAIVHWVAKSQTNTFRDKVRRAVISLSYTIT